MNKVFVMPAGRGGLKSVLLLALLMAGGCASATREPRNLQLAKSEMVAYVESGAYDRDLAEVAARAKQWLERRAADGDENRAVVFDIDETLLRNWEQMRGDDFGYILPRWNAWVDSARAPAIEPMREVFQAARRLGFAVFVLTSRPESQRAPTARNLTVAGLGDHTRLVCKPDGDRRTSAEFKTAERQRLAGEGFVIVANLGDQQSDLAGGFAERTFKLPNPFYLTN